MPCRTRKKIAKKSAIICTISFHCHMESKPLYSQKQLLVKGPRLCAIPGTDDIRYAISFPSTRSGVYSWRFFCGWPAALARAGTAFAVPGAKHCTAWIIHAQSFCVAKDLPGTGLSHDSGETVYSCSPAEAVSASNVCGAHSAWIERVGVKYGVHSQFCQIAASSQEPGVQHHQYPGTSDILDDISGCARCMWCGMCGHMAACADSPHFPPLLHI